MLSSKQALKHDVFGMPCYSLLPLGYPFATHLPPFCHHAHFARFVDLVRFVHFCSWGGIWPKMKPEKQALKHNVLCMPCYSSLPVCHLFATMSTLYDLSTLYGLYTFASEGEYGPKCYLQTSLKTQCFWHAMLPSGYPLDAVIVCVSILAV